MIHSAWWMTGDVYVTLRVDPATRCGTVAIRANGTGPSRTDTRSLSTPWLQSIRDQVIVTLPRLGVTDPVRAHAQDVTSDRHLNVLCDAEPYEHVHTCSLAKLLLVPGAATEPSKIEDYHIETWVQVGPVDIIVFDASTTIDLQALGPARVVGNNRQLTVPTCLLPVIMETATAVRDQQRTWGWGIDEPENIVWGRDGIYAAAYHAGAHVPGGQTVFCDHACSEEHAGVSLPLEMLEMLCADPPREWSLFDLVDSRASSPAPVAMTISRADDGWAVTHRSTSAPGRASGR